MIDGRRLLVVGHQSSTDNDNTNIDDLTSDSFDDEAAKEEMFQAIQNKTENKLLGGMSLGSSGAKTIKADPFGESGNGDDKDKMDFNKSKVTKDDKMQKKFDSKIGDLLSNFKKMREMKFGRKEDEDLPL
jgi:hypothetical protein